MDKVKQILELLRKHHFWILCGLSVLVGLIVWKMAAGDLEARFTTDSQKISSTLSQLQQTSSAADQPHDDWAAGQNKQTDAIRQDVRKTWEDLYNQQKKEVFIWPEQLGKDFIEEIKKTEGTKNEILPKLRDRYLNAVRPFVAELPKIVEAAPLEEIVPAGVGAGAPVAAAANSGEYKVNWKSESLSAIDKSFTWEDRQSTLMVRFAQEELWVYQALCKVIHAVNEGSGIGDAPVKEIEEMKIAYPAVALELPAFGGSGQKRIFSLLPATIDASATAPPTAGGDKTVPSIIERGKSSSDHGSIFSGPAADPAAAANPDAKWKGFRYVNAKGEPRPAEEIDTPPAEAAQFNMMPFALTLQVDNRYIDRLLVAFRNSTLPLEVQQVRINPQTAGGGSAGGFQAGAARPTAGASGQPAQTRLVTLDVRGVAYLIKPVDLTNLQTAPNTEQPTPEQNPTPNPSTDQNQTPAPAPTPEPTQPGGAAGTTQTPPAGA